jgi:2-octaprenyl-6-methoxyphenol hydroxylase
LVVNFSHEKKHNNIAYEVFYNTGPLAILPMMSTSKKNFSSSMIWSHTKEYSDALNELDENIRKEIIQEKILRYSGNLIKIFDVKKFNLSAHLNSKFFEKRLVYIGDAAHSIHPIAGQGWNLGVRDIKKLLLVINKNLNLGLDIGTEEVCSSYNNLAYNDAYSLFQITDKLNYIFLNESNMAKVLRKVGFKAIEKNLKLKNFISNYAMGI